MKTKEKRDGIIGEELDLEDLDMSAVKEEEIHEEEHHSKLSMIFHLLMVIAAVVIVVVIVSVLMLKNNPVTYNDIDASEIEVSGVYESI